MEIEGGIIGGISNVQQDNIEAIKFSLRQHQTELNSIMIKLNNCKVPFGKKEKLLYRKDIITTKVIPDLNKKLHQAVQRALPF